LIKLEKMISTKNIGGEQSSSTPKTLQPGNNACKILGLKLEPTRFDPKAFNVMLSLEGNDLGSDFEGFFINKDDESLGRHKGQVGRVRLSEYAYQDGTTKSGIKVNRDYEILRALQNLCKVTGCTDWFEKQDNQHDTIESFVNQFDSDLPCTDKFVNFCIGGKEYQNKQGYTNFDLYVVKPARGQYGYESADVAPENSKLMKFDSALHIKKSKSDTVTSFGDGPVTTSSSVSNDFEL
jgi:hypothetical protein